jgi:hypothetical protein
MLPPGRTLCCHLGPFRKDANLPPGTKEAEDQTISSWIRHTLRTAAERQIFDGTLHNAMRIILLERETYMATTQELGVEIGRRGLYTRKYGNAARAKQINARVREYPEVSEFAGPGVVRIAHIPLSDSEAND